MQSGCSDNVVLSDTIIIHRKESSDGVQQDSIWHPDRAKRPASAEEHRRSGKQRHPAPRFHSHVSVQIHSTIMVDDGDTSDVHALGPATPAKHKPVGAVGYTARPADLTFLQMIDIVTISRLCGSVTPPDVQPARTWRQSTQPLGSHCSGVPML